MNMKQAIVTWVLLLSAACAATAAPMNTANRTSGVAPLAVFFDVVNAGDPVFDPMNAPTIFGLADYHFDWNFGDDDAARWSTNDRPKNRATGFVAAHVYESAGEYFVTLRVTTPDGTDHDFEQVIRVLDPDVVFANRTTDRAERTLYVSALGNDANNGSFNRPLRSWERARTLLFASNGPRRALLRRGDAFTNTGGGTVAGRTGPFQVGAYGSGAAPIINSTDPTNAVLQLDATATDVRMMDIDMVGDVVGPGVRPGNDTLLLRCSLTNFGNGITTSSLHGLKQGVVVADTTIQNSERFGVYFNFGQHVAFLGDILDDVNDEHLLLCASTHSLIQHTIFREGHPGKHQLKFVGFSPTGNPDRAAGTPTETVEYTIIADNFFEAFDLLNWPVTIGPADSSKDQRLSHVIFERNTLVAGSRTSDMVYLSNSLVTVRNNVFDATGAPNAAAVRVAQRGIEPPPCGHRILRNTMYRADGAQLVGVQVDAPALSILAYENLVSAPNAVAVQGEDFRVESSGNLVTLDAGFAAPEHGDFSLRPGSPAIDQGESVPSVFSDFLGIVRPVDGDASGTAQDDIGAFEFIPSRPTKQRVPSVWPVERAPRPYSP